MERTKRPSAAELNECAEEGMSLREMAERYSRSTKQIKRWFIGYDMDWWRSKQRSDNTWVELLAGGRFEDDPRAAGRRDGIA